MSLPLTRELRKQLCAGKTPSITGEGECPVARGHREPIAKNLDLVVDQIHPRRGGGWRVLYTLEDRRDAPRLLRRTPPVVVPEPDNRLPTAEAIKQGAQESSYTSSPAGAITDAGEAVDEQTQDRFTREAAEGFKAQLERERRERQSRRLDERLRAVQALADTKGIDLTRKLRRVEDGIAAAEREVGRDDV